MSQIVVNLTKTLMFFRLCLSHRHKGLTKQHFYLSCLYDRHQRTIHYSLITNLLIKDIFIYHRLSIRWHVMVKQKEHTVSMLQYWHTAQHLLKQVISVTIDGLCHKLSTQLPPCRLRATPRRWHLPFISCWNNSIIRIIYIQIKFITRNNFKTTNLFNNNLNIQYINYNYMHLSINGQIHISRYILSFIIKT